MDRIVVVFFHYMIGGLILAVCYMYENDNFFICFYGYLPRENRRTPESHGWISVYSFGIHVKAVQCIVIKLQLYPGKSTGIFN
ncbi:Uncharacterised protein [Citrobacter koseri]|uniref:Uncharacterized protein n=1 Tax=Citrobacter koseri TaxID=545 RepID=A0A3S4I3B0_CITKO|nr:Uncharacterised protein [Citrobacter koseri]